MEMKGREKERKGTKGREWEQGGGKRRGGIGLPLHSETSHS